MSIIVGLSAAGCAQISTLGANAAQVDYSDGVDKKEAAELAAAYLEKHMAVSFSHIPPVEAGSEWHVKIAGDAVPVELADVPQVRIDKKTGEITWDAKPPLKRK